MKCRALVELDGKPQSDVKISFAASIAGAREVNGQEQPVGSATVTNGALVTSFGAYQPRTFAIRLTAPSTSVSRVSRPPYPLPIPVQHRAMTETPQPAASMAKATLSRRRCCRRKSSSTMSAFNLLRRRLGHPMQSRQRARRSSFHRVITTGFTCSRLRPTATRKQRSRAGGKKTELNIEDWGGFVGQWDNRQWSPADQAHGKYGEMRGSRQALSSVPTLRGIRAIIMMRQEETSTMPILTYLGMDRAPACRKNHQAAKQ